jgi:periplasmic divalent cation tolerance protein
LPAPAGLRALSLEFALPDGARRKEDFVTPYVVAFVTVASAREGSRLARTLVEEKLAACVNVAPGLESHYRWKGKVESARERLLIIKTRRSKARTLVRRVRALHSYTVPEVIFMPILEGNNDYLKWIGESVR